jgi:hypothetical protein
MNIRDAGYKVNSVWTCDIERELSKNEKMFEYFQNPNIWSGLKDSIRTSREAYYGGRTECSLLNCELTDQEIQAGFYIKWMDIVYRSNFYGMFSILYPFINMANKYYMVYTAVSEWLRRWSKFHWASSRVGSNPTRCDIFFCGNLKYRYIRTLWLQD